MTIEIIKTVSEYYDLDDEDFEEMSPEDIFEYVEENTTPDDVTIREKIQEVIITDADGNESVIDGSSEVCARWEDA